MRIHLVTAESPESRALRSWRLIQFPQLTMPLIAALTPPEHEVYHTDEIVETVDFHRPADLVGITSPTPSALHAYRLSDEFRRRGIPVVMGGPHATALPEEALAHADAVVAGEAEDTWPRVLEDCAAGRLSGVYRSSGRASLAGMRPPRWDLIKGRRYGKSVTIATRGCPHQCDYCSIPLLYGPGRVRYRPIAEIVDEVRLSPTRAVVFWDDNIGANPRYAKELFDALTPLRKWWTSQCTLRVASDEEFVSKAAASGCKALFLGLESISQESLESSRKSHNRVDQYQTIIQRLHRHGIAVHLGIMFGFDEDDASIFERTLRFLESTAVDVTTISMVVPMPGTPTFAKLQAEGRILSTDWSRYDGKKHCVFQPARMTPRELEAGTEWAARRFYSWASIARRLTRSGAGLWWNFPRNVGYHLALARDPFNGFNPAPKRSAFQRGLAAAAAACLLCVCASRAPAKTPPETGAASLYLRPGEAGAFQRIAQHVPESWLVRAGMRAAQLIGLFPGQLSRARPLIAAEYERLGRDPGFKNLPSAVPLHLSRRDPGHYYRYVPVNYDRAKRWPVIVFLHGWGGNFQYYPWWWSHFAEDNGFIVLEPTFGQGFWWQEPGAKDALDALNETEKHFSVDERRVFLAGQSNGCLGLWSVYARRPGSFAGLVCISGAARPEEARTIARSRVPVLFIHGGRDANIPIEAGRRAAQEIAADGGRTEFVEFPDADHFVMAESREQIFATLKRWIDVEHGGQ